MTKLNLGPIGFALDLSEPAAYLDDAAELEALGYSTIWLPGGQIDSLDRFGEIIRATATIAVAPAIISLDVYPPDEVARLYADLEGAAPGRFIVGLGGPQRPRPLQAINAYLDALDGAEPPVPGDRRILAALGPRKLQLSRDRAAGAIALLVTPAYTADARSILGSDSILVVDQLVVLETDADRARETARGPLRFLSGVTGYAANFARMGFSSAEIGDLADRLVDELVVWGDVDAIAERIFAQRAAGADHVAIGVLGGGDRRGSVEVARRLADTLPERRF